MADFQPALAITLKHEGGFADRSKTRPDSTGEVVNMGITLDTLRSLGILKSKGPASEADIFFVKTLTEDEAADIYRQQYWDKIELDGVNSQEVANKVFDLAVNTGTHQSVVFLQKAVGTVADGDLGAITLIATNRADPNTTLSKIRLYAETFYRDIAMNNPALAPDLSGWLARLASA